MKRIPLIASILVIASVLVTSAFTRPLASRNGIVVSYTPGKSLVLHSGGVNIDYIVRGTTFANVQGLGTGARVTVWATCVGGANSAANLALKQSIANLQAKFGVTTSGQTGANGPFGSTNPQFNKAMHNLVEGNANPCIAVFVKVRSAATGVPATGGTGGAAATGTSAATSAATTAAPSSAATTAAPSAAASSTPAASATSSGSTGGAAGATSATATMTATPCPTQVLTGPGTPTATPDMTMMCGTPTPTSTP